MTYPKLTVRSYPSAQVHTHKKQSRQLTSKVPHLRILLSSRLRQNLRCMQPLQIFNRMILMRRPLLRLLLGLRDQRRTESPACTCSSGGRDLGRCGTRYRAQESGGQRHCCFCGGLEKAEEGIVGNVEQPIRSRACAEGVTVCWERDVTSLPSVTHVLVRSRRLMGVYHQFRSWVGALAATAGVELIVVVLSVHPSRCIDPRQRHYHALKGSGPLCLTLSGLDRCLCCRQALHDS